MVLLGGRDLGAPVIVPFGHVAVLSYPKPVVTDLDVVRDSSDTARHVQGTPTPDLTAQAALYLPVALHALAREERAGRRPHRLLEANHATWQRFRGQMGPRDLVELLLEDAAVTQREPFDVRAVLGVDEPFAALDEATVASWLEQVAAKTLDEPLSDDLEQHAKHLGLLARPAFSELRKLEPHHRVLELPGTGGRLAAHVVATQPGIFLQDVFTIACATWQERMLAGVVAVGLGIVGETRILVDPDLAQARRADAGFTHVFGLRPEKGGRFTAHELAGWFSSASVALV